MNDMVLINLESEPQTGRQTGMRTTDVALLFDIIIIIFGINGATNNQKVVPYKRDLFV